MSFRARITLAAALAVAIAVILASALAYVLVQHELVSQVDNNLRDRASRIVNRPLDHRAKRRQERRALGGLLAPDRARGPVDDLILVLGAQ